MSLLHRLSRPSSEGLRLALNSGFALIALVVTRFGNALFFILLTWKAGETEAGTFALGMSYALFCTQLALWGIDHILTRDVAADRRLAGRLLGSFLALRLLVAVGYYALLVLWVLLGPHDAHTQNVILVLGATILTESLGRLCQAYFTAFERLSYLALLNALLGLLKLLIGLAVLWRGGDALAASWVVLAASALTMLVGLALVYLRFPAPRWSALAPHWRGYMPIIVPFILTSMLNTVELQADNLLVAYLAPGNPKLAVGVYNVATMFLFGLWLLPWSYRTSLLPMMARFREQDMPGLRQLYEKSTVYLLALTLPLAILLTVYSDPVLRLIYAERFREAVPVLAVLIWALVLMAANIPAACVLIVEHRHAAMTLIQALATLVNLSLNLLLIPRLGPEGAAWARIGSSAAAFALTFGWVSWRLHEWSFGRDVLRLSSALAALGLALLVLDYLVGGRWVLGALLGSCVYLIAVILSGLIRADDWAKLLRVMGYFRLIATRIRHQDAINPPN